MGGCARFLHGLLVFLQVGVAAAVIAITATKLNRISIEGANFDYTMDQVCLLGTGASGANMCYYAYGVAGVSLLATAALGILQCVTCNLCGLGFLLDTIFAAAGTIWWAVAGYVFHSTGMKYTLSTTMTWKESIPILCWVGTGLFGAAFLVNLFRMLSSCCGCCGGGGSRGGGGDYAGGYGGKASPNPQVVVVPAGPPAGYPPQSQFIASGGPAPYHRY